MSSLQKKGLTFFIASDKIRTMKIVYDKDVFSEEEIQIYVSQAKEKIPNLSTLKFSLDGDRVKVDYTAHAQPFERIRRITGYLTGDLTSWNDAKRSEEHERVKHSTENQW